MRIVRRLLQSVLAGLCLALIFSPISLRAAEVTSLYQVRMAKLLAPFLGNFQMPSGFGYTEAVGYIEHGELQYWYILGGNGTSHLFSVKLELIGTERHEVRQTSRGQALNVKSARMDGNTITTTETETARFWKTVEVRSVTAQPGTVLFEMKRTYFKRKYGLAGPWVIDEKSWLSKMNSMDFQRPLFLISATPMPFDAFRDMASKRPAVYIQMRESVTADQLRDKLEKGEFDYVICDESLKGPEKED